MLSGAKPLKNEYMPPGLSSLNAQNKAGCALRHLGCSAATV